MLLHTVDEAMAKAKVFENKARGIVVPEDSVVDKEITLSTILQRHRKDYSQKDNTPYDWDAPDIITENPNEYIVELNIAGDGTNRAFFRALYEKLCCNKLKHSVK